MKHLLFVLSVMLSVAIYSQNDAVLFDNLVSDEASVMPVLFNYPDSIRTTILVASTYPQGFVRLNGIQKISSEAFKKLVSSYSREKQKQLWDLTRYNGLTKMLVDSKGKTPGELDELLKKYPAKIKKTAQSFVKKDYTTLVEIERIRRDFETNYKAETSGFPNNVKYAFNSLLNNPELLTILSDNIKTTITLGDIYTRNPELIKRKTDSLSFAIAQANGIEYEDWKNGIKKDTALQKELTGVAKQYTQDNGYDDDVYANPNDPQYTVPHNTGSTVVINPYPYWSGYPYWYGYNYWYPYPWWYQTGFYSSWNGPMMFYGMPGYHFGWWYYNQPAYFYNRYPHTTNYFQNHYEGHRNSGSEFNRSGNQFYGGRRK